MAGPERDPAGSLPDSNSRAAGKPRVTIVNVLCLPARNVTWSQEAKAGGWWTVSVNACFAARDRLRRT